jgi:hypothetical protein
MPAGLSAAMSGRAGTKRTVTARPAIFWPGVSGLPHTRSVSDTYCVVALLCRDVMALLPRDVMALLCRDVVNCCPVDQALLPRRSSTP